MAVKPSLPAAAFAKALRSLETGGLSNSGVLAEIRELLAAGASPTELRDTLLGRELIEPLSAQARAEILGLLNSAMLRERQRVAAAEKQGTTSETATNPPETSSDPVSTTESSATARVSALEAALAAARAELQSERKVARDAARAATQAAADSLVSLETARAHADQAD